MVTRLQLLSVADGHGPIDVRRGLSSGYVHVQGKRLQPLCRKLKIKFANALVRFNGRSRFGWSPQFDGVVVSTRSAPRLLCAIEERQQRAEKRPPLTDEVRQARRERRQRKDEKRLLAAIFDMFPSIPL